MVRGTTESIKGSGRGGERKIRGTMDEKELRERENDVSERICEATGWRRVKTEYRDATCQE